MQANMCVCARVLRVGVRVCVRQNPSENSQVWRERPMQNGKGGIGKRKHKIVYDLHSPYPVWSKLKDFREQSP